MTDTAQSQVVHSWPTDPLKLLYLADRTGASFENEVIERLDGPNNDTPVYAGGIDRGVTPKRVIIAWYRPGTHRYFHPLTGERLPQAVVDQFYAWDGAIHATALQLMLRIGELEDSGLTERAAHAARDLTTFQTRARDRWLAELLRTAR